MSKTITIPTNCNPYIVVINNHVYTYKAGDTVEVPDEVAEAIEDALELEPKPKRYLSKFSQFVEGSITELTASDLDEVETIAPYAFNYCVKLKRVTIPKGITKIDAGAFYGSNNIEVVIFEDGDKPKSIESTAFSRCAKLVSVFLPKVPPLLANIDAFSVINANCVFYCKDQASLNAYKAATNWSTLAGTYSFVVEP